MPGSPQPMAFSLASCMASRRLCYVEVTPVGYTDMLRLT